MTAKEKQMFASLYKERDEAVKKLNSHQRAKDKKQYDNPSYSGREYRRNWDNAAFGMSLNVCEIDREISKRLRKLVDGKELEDE